MECHHPHAAGASPKQQLDAIAHLLRGLVGEGDREQLVGARLAAVDQVGDAMSEHARLARAGAGEDQQRPLVVHDGLPLGGVEALEKRLDALVGDAGLGHQARIVAQAASLSTCSATTCAGTARRSPPRPARCGSTSMPSSAWTARLRRSRLRRSRASARTSRATCSPSTRSTSARVGFRRSESGPEAPATTRSPPRCASTSPPTDRGATRSCARLTPRPSRRRSARRPITN